MSKSVPATLRLVMGSEPLNLERAVEQAESFFKLHLHDTDFIYNIILIASEAITNGMRHGNDFDPDKEVTIEYMVHVDRVEITVEDEGSGFRRESLFDPLSREHMLDEGGRGIFLMEHIADKVDYELDGRRVRVTFKRPPQG